jgi:hypothetical protein
MVTQLYRHATGRREVVLRVPRPRRRRPTSSPPQGNRFRELLQILVTSDVFRTVSEEET